MACGDLAAPIDDDVALADLLILPMSAGAPAVAPVTRHIPNDRVITVRLAHADQFNSLYAEIRFPIGSLTSLDGVGLSERDSVLVTIRPEVGRYGLRIDPSNLVFAPSSRPFVTFGYGSYGDLSVFAGSRYQSPSALAGALQAWQRMGGDRWERLVGSTPGIDVVTGYLSAGGETLVAALR